MFIIKIESIFLLIVALDRFADFLTDKANIIVRETSS